jgi:hypothetical protein
MCVLSINVGWGCDVGLWQPKRAMAGPWGFSICQAGTDKLFIPRQTHRGHSWLTAEALQAIDAKGPACLACKGSETVGTAEARTRYAPLRTLLGTWFAGKRERIRNHMLRRSTRPLGNITGTMHINTCKTLGADQEVSNSTIGLSWQSLNGP